MAELPDKDKLLRNFSRCANWEEKYAEAEAARYQLTESEKKLNERVACLQHYLSIMTRRLDGELTSRVDMCVEGVEAI